ncbi:DUF4162 domain-containing protein [Micromonospora sp. NPDC001898]|uniref:ATP-binding protein DrrA1-3 family domain-containing protein n=1 Tax=Micromonospora sp. NPDC001898 TaxID=3364221 RepID=UPI003680D998
MRVLATLLRPDSGTARVVGRLLDLTRRDATRRADELLSRFGLTEVGNRRVAAYSGGMRRRLDLAASLVGHPQVVFLYLEEADTLADAVMVIDRGRVIASGTPAQLKQQVGGHTVNVRVNDPADADRAAAILTAVTDRTPARSTRRQLAVPVSDDDDFLQIAAELRRQAVDISELSLRLPSLDEAFRALTSAAAATPTP